MAGWGLMARKQDPGRRDFLKKAAYSAPAVLTLQAVSGLAKAGSEKSDPGDEAEEEAEEDEDEAVEIDQQYRSASGATLSGYGCLSEAFVVEW